jgi:predicted O-methyltransferase YrrM
VTISEQLRKTGDQVKGWFGSRRPTSSALEARVRSLEETVAKLSGAPSAGAVDGEQLAAFEKRLNEWAPLTFSAGLLLGRGSRLGERVVGPVGFERVVAQIAEISGRDRGAARRDLQVAYRNMIIAEARSLGRIAGSSLNILGKLVTPRLLEPPGGQILEIGTLFGVFGGALAQEVARTGAEVQLTVVDPLEGVQLQSGRDVNTDVSGTPVTEAVVRRNLEAAGLPAPRFRIVRGFSTDDSVRQQVGDRTYGLVIIDGDHSEAGVAADLAWVESLVEPGSVLVLDDYGDDRWPGVETAVDKHLARSSRFRMAGVVSTSAYLIADGG